ncbi:hypothetical protein [Kitasatospora sp. NPDC004531]
MSRDPGRSFDAQGREGNAYQAGQNQTFDHSRTVHHHDAGRGRAVLGAVAVLSVCGLVLGLYLTNRGVTGRAAPDVPAPAAGSAGQGSAAAPAVQVQVPVPAPASEEIVLQDAGLGDVQVLDLDRASGRSERLTDDAWRLRDAQEQASFDLVTTNASWAEFTVPAGGGRSAGVLKPGEPVTRESCLRAARSGSLVKLRISNLYRSELDRVGLQPGGTICVLTDHHQLVRATVTDRAFANDDESTTGRLTVEVSSLGPVTG